jgi:hypothetical protein
MVTPADDSGALWSRLSLPLGAPDIAGSRADGVPEPL